MLAIHLDDVLAFPRDGAITLARLRLPGARHPVPVFRTVSAGRSILSGSHARVKPLPFDGPYQKLIELLILGRAQEDQSRERCQAPTALRG
jgi:hypothetical protein